MTNEINRDSKRDFASFPESQNRAQGNELNLLKIQNTAPDASRGESRIEKKEPEKVLEEKLPSSSQDLQAIIQFTEGGFLLKKFMERTANPKPELACDRRPQLPSLAALVNTCGIDLKSKFELVKESTVRISSALPGAGNGGSGFYACSSDKSLCAIVTNEHVAEKVDRELFVRQDDGRSSKAVVVAVDKANDLALVQPIQAPFYDSKFPPVNLKPVIFGTPVEHGDKVFSVCNPTSSIHSTFVAAGEVTANFERPIIIGIKSSPPSIISNQVDFSGCSGGANFNKWGELAGVVRAVGVRSFEFGNTISIRPIHVRHFLDSEALKLQQKKKQ